ncbi:MAG: hypothetical protein V4773_14350 [Verrucomicrobiota bacterium]
MHLVQKRLGFPAFEFDLEDDCLRVRTRSLTGSSSYEVALAELSPRTSSYSHRPILWYCFAAFMTLCTAVSAFGVFGGAQLPDKAGVGILFVVCTSVGMIATYEALRRHVDYVIVHWELGGAAVHFHRTLPTERHVQEFIDILKERIAAAKLDSKEENA